MLALLPTLILNLLRCKGFRSIRAGLMACAHKKQGEWTFQSALVETPVGRWVRERTAWCQQVVERRTGFKHLNVQVST